MFATATTRPADETGPLLLHPDSLLAQLRAAHFAGVVA
jgi:hypothetical protein